MNRFGRHIFLLQLFVTFVCRLPAQISPLYFDKITSQNGLSNNKVNCILQDTRGFIWFGADGGLTRYDYRLSPRRQFIQYKHLPADTNSIPVNMLNALLEDRRGDIWIATSG